MECKPSNDHFSNIHNTLSIIDISLCSLFVINDFEWHVLHDIYSSEHYLIVKTGMINQPNEFFLDYNVNKADWEKYNLYKANSSL